MKNQYTVLRFRHAFCLMVVFAQHPEDLDEMMKSTLASAVASL
jgi:hypothetical protein